ncbi:MAG: hypothetical protein R3322_00240 [Kiloniellales bacterium]|nr:hypothetical protein [Kiloniellales bacterium]
MKSSELHAAIAHLAIARHQANDATHYVDMAIDILSGSADEDEFEDRFSAVDDAQLALRKAVEALDNAHPHLEAVEAESVWADAQDDAEEEGGEDG